MKHKAIISHAAEAAAAVRPGFPKRLMKKQECFVVLCLDASHKQIGRPKMVALGTVSSVEVHPRDIFREAVRRNAATVIIAHNHPSGSLDPGLEDRALTERLVKAGDLLRIPVLDHLIITKDEHVSLAELGWISE